MRPLVCRYLFVLMRALVKYLPSLLSTGGYGRVQHKELRSKVIKDRKSRRTERQSERELKER